MATTGWKVAGTLTSTNWQKADGSNEAATASDVSTSDDFWAKAAVAKAAASDTLVLTNFGFTTSDIPSGATINGVEVLIEGHCNVASSNYDNALNLYKGGASTGSNMASATYWPTTDTQVSYGGSSNLWGATLADSDIRNSGFGISYSSFNNGSNADSFFVDYVAIRVTYSVGGSSTRARRSASLIW